MIFLKELKKGGRSVIELRGEGAVVTEKLVGQDL